MFLIIPLMSFLARGAGGDWFKAKTIFGLLFGAVFGLAKYSETGSILWSVLSFLISWRGFEFGHGTFYAMIGYYDHNRNPSKPDTPRIQTLERVFRPLYVFFGGDIMRPLYSWYMMAIKGAIIGLALGFYEMLALAILWPAAYWIGQRVLKGKYGAHEWLSGACAGFVIALALA